MKRAKTTLVLSFFIFLRLGIFLFKHFLFNYFKLLEKYSFHASTVTAFRSRTTIVKKKKYKKMFCIHTHKNYGERELLLLL